MKTAFLSIAALLFTVGAAFAQTSPPTYDELKVRAERAESRLRDWPDLARYKEANSKLSMPTRSDERVVFLGDSITDSWKLDEYFPGRKFINRGISGQTTPQMLIRFRPDVIALRPRAVVILAGTNDIAGNTGPMSIESIQNNIKSMAELATANKIKVVLASVLPISDHNKNAQGNPIIRSVIRPPEKILALNKWIKEYAAQNRHIYLDYFSATADDKGFLRAEIANDGLHPNAEGYRIMAPLAANAIDIALRK
jgi:lysophospholipase L1-like esterase